MALVKRGVVKINSFVICMGLKLHNYKDSYKFTL